MKCGPGLYYFDTDKSDKPLVQSSSFISTFKEKNHILVDVKFKDWIEITTYK